MEGPKELSLSEIRKYMLDNNCKVTNHALVKHFKRFLTHPQTQSESVTNIVVVFLLVNLIKEINKITCCL